MINKVKKGYKDQFSMEIHKVDNVNRGLYTVDGSIHPRKDLQLVKGNVYHIYKIKWVNYSRTRLSCTGSLRT